MVADVSSAVQAIVASGRTRIAAQFAMQWVGLIAASFWPEDLIHGEVTQLPRSWLQLPTFTSKSCLVVLIWLDFGVPAVRLGALDNRTARQE
jgi:hypothetical protein